MRLLALVAALLALALAPVVAGAQSAGDDQYQDPFAGQDGGGQEDPGAGGGGGQDGSSGGGGQEDPAAGGGGGHAPAADGGGQAPVAQAGGGAPSIAAPKPAPVASGTTGSEVAELPYTGVRTGLLTVLGGALLLAGAMLRLRLRHAPGRR